MKASSLKQISRSELRHRILSSLNLEPASSVTSLAQRLGVLRPSVSRTVKSLQDAGLITRSGRAISLSEAGREELRILDTELSNKVKKSTDLASRILLQHATETKRLMEPIIKSGILESLNYNSSLSKISADLANSPLLQVGKALANSPLYQLGETINISPFLQAAKVIGDDATLQAMEAIKATAHIQIVNLGLFQSWHQEPRSPLNHLVLENNVLLSKMMVDLEAITGLKTEVDKTLVGLINQTAWTTKAYGTYFADVVSGFYRQIPTFDSLELSLAIPTTAAASLVGSTRYIVESETITPTAEAPANLYTARTYIYSEKFVVLTPKLEAYLKPLGQRFIDKWEGAWQTLYSGNKDRQSQATHSGRELLMQVLAYLAPDNVFTKEDCKRHGVDKPSRKMRIKYILGNNHKSTVELIDSMADTLDRMYDVLVGEAHRRDDNSHLEDTIVGQLAALGASLIMLLSLHSIDINEDELP
jgi:DNA-binding MarR family transcriptional regulator